MIIIEEKKSQKVVGETSLFISFNYKPQYVDILKTYAGLNYNKKDKIWEVPISYLADIIDNFCPYDDIELKILKDKKEHKLIEPILPEFKVKPLKHQEEGIKYGLTHDKWLLLDAPGLGKGFQAPLIAQEIKKRDNIEHCLVICGLSSLKENWRSEIHKFTDLSCTILGERQLKNGRIVIDGVQQRLKHLKRKIDEFFIITNIETLRNDDVIKELKSGINKIDMIIFDECQKCKSPGSEQSKNLLKLNTSDYKIAMTGTLLTNSPLDAYVPLKWIGVERSTFTNFKYYYCKFGGEFGNILVGYKNLDLLKETIEKYSLRRTKDLLDLPEKTLINEYVEMEPDQESFYEEVKAGVRDQVDKVKLTSANLLALTTRLRQATDFPGILSTKNISCGKLDRAESLVEEILSNNEKVVVFSSFKNTVYELQKRLSEYNPIVITGDTRDSDIESLKTEFQTNPDKKVFIATHQKMGTGQTLTAASYMIFISTPWTDADYVQAQDRIHRIGAKKPVFIYNLITKNTIDERVLEIVQDKGAIADYVIDDKITEQGLNSLRKYLEEL